MSSLTLVITDAGRAALVDAQNTGTNSILIAAIGVTDQVFTAAADTVAVPGELKRLTTFAGTAVAADTIHVSIQDDTTDAYSLHGFALYLDDGTLFASYGQADTIGEKSAQSMFLLALDVIFADIDATSLTFGATNFVLPSATTEQQGIVELATNAEADTGSDATRALTPATAKHAADTRFGAGAPTSLAKELLATSTAALIRTLLELKSAALKDAGAGNGLDADQLDGQHGDYYLDWLHFTGVPKKFPPSGHEHAAADVISGTFPVTRGGTGAASLVSNQYLLGNGTAAVLQKTAAQVLAHIGAAPASHTHTTSQISGLSAYIQQIVTAFNGANFSYSGNGYQRLPGGALLQWMNVTLSGTSNSIVFPIAFSNGALLVIGAGAETPEYGGAHITSKTGASMVWNTSPGACVIFAIGK